MVVHAQDKVIDLNGKWRFSIGDSRSWSSPTVDDSSWEFVKAPDMWENQGFYGYDGYAWYRKTFDGRKLQKGAHYYLNLGYIDDVDEAYLNGEKIGFSGFFPPRFKTAYKAERVYFIPSEYINFNGQNTIAIRIFDVVNEGGIVRGDLGVYRSSSGPSLVVDLQGLWSFRTGWHPDGNGLLWDKLMVPMPWEVQGFEGYDGYATYKKVFKLPKELPSENLVLVLGKIDDFDRTYFNGRLIGSTRDNKRFGQSGSYKETRVYEIPRDLLLPGQENIITIQVQDLGHTGGFWKGPVGITTRTKYYRYYRD